MNKSEKHEAVKGLSDEFRSLSSILLMDYRGLGVVQDGEIRRKIREMDGTYKVVKNRLALRAAQDTAIETLSRHFQGPTAMAYHPSDIVGLAKVISEVIKGNAPLTIKAALVEGKEVSQEQVQAIADLPPKEVMLGQIAFLLKAPLQQLATVLKASLRDLCLVLKQVPK